MTNSAHQGRRVEWAVRDHLIENGYEVIRAAGSKGPCDLIALKPGQVLAINVKRTTAPGPSERAELIRVSRMLPGLVPLVAIGRPHLSFRRLLGEGAKQWEPWVADELDWDDDAAVAAEYRRRIGADRPLAERAARARELSKDAPIIARSHTPSVCDPNALTGCCRWDHDHTEETR